MYFFQPYFFLPTAKGSPDLVALVIAVIMTLVVAAGVKKSVVFNNALNVINMAVWVFILVAGFFFINGEYWTEDGFLPFGFSGVGIGVDKGRSKEKETIADVWKELEER